MRKFMLLMSLVLAVLLCGCADKITKVYVSDENQDGMYHLSPGDVLGNNSIDIHSSTDDTPAYTVVHNLSPVSIGYDIRKSDDSSFICFADSYIGGNDYSIQQGNLPLDEWLKIRLVVYESGLAGWAVVFLQGLGLDFFSSVEDYMIDSVYEAEFIFQSNKGMSGLKWTDLDWKEIPKEQIFEK